MRSRATDVDGGDDRRARYPDARRPQADRRGPLRASGRGAGGGGRHAVAELSIAVGLRFALAAAAGAASRDARSRRSAASKWWLFVALASAYVLAYRRKLARLHQAARRRAAGHRPGAGDSARRDLATAVVDVRAAGGRRPRSSRPRSPSGWWCPGCRESRDPDSDVTIPVRDTGVAVEPRRRARDLGIAVGCPLGAKAALGRGRGGLRWRVARLI